MNRVTNFCVFGGLAVVCGFGAVVAPILAIPALLCGMVALRILFGSSEASSGWDDGSSSYPPPLAHHHHHHHHHVPPRVNNRGSYSPGYPPPYAAPTVGFADSAFARHSSPPRSYEYAPLPVSFSPASSAHSSGFGAESAFGGRGITHASFHASPQPPANADAGPMGFGSDSHFGK